jgi:hypothetical protein
MIRLTIEAPEPPLRNSIVPAVGDDPLQNMRERASQCRRLSSLTHDQAMAQQLRQWAEEIERDIDRLEAELANKGGAQG